MYAIEFNATIHDGKIEVPAIYKNKFISDDVKVIILRSEKIASPTKHIKSDTKGFGLLSHRANSSLWDLETQAMEKAVVKKYDVN